MEIAAASPQGRNEDELDILDTLYQHTVFCQTSLPYRNPDPLREYERRNGRVRLRMDAGTVIDPRTDSRVEVGLPFGPRPRVVLIRLSTEAVLRQSPVIELEHNLTAFAKQVLQLDKDPSGQTMRVIRDQVNRLAASRFQFDFVHAGRSVTVKCDIIDAFTLWAPRSAAQNELWPSHLRLSDRFFRSLVEHAVPLAPHAIKMLQHSAVALDVYQWLGQRLHRVPPGGQFVAYQRLREQFGPEYEGMNDFRRMFLRTLKQVQDVYREAKFRVDGGGMHLQTSRPPILKVLVGVK